jgi:hypothetical protein
VTTVTAPVTLSTFLANAVATAQARGVTDAEALRRIRLDAIDHWQNDLNWSFSGAPRGSSASN